MLLGSITFKFLSVLIEFNTPSHQIINELTVQLPMKQINNSETQIPSSGRLEYSGIIPKNMHKLPEKEIQKYVYFPREFDFALMACRDDFPYGILRGSCK